MIFLDLKTKKYGKEEASENRKKIEISTNVVSKKLYSCWCHLIHALILKPQINKIAHIYIWHAAS